MSLPRFPKILIVDDEAFIRSTIKHMLRAVGRYDVMEARDGASGLALVQSFAPDLILCDVGMEPMSGLDFVKELRGLADALARKTPVIMLTVESKEETVFEAMRLGISGYILKPVSAKELRARMTAAITPSPDRGEPARPLTS